MMCFELCAFICSICNVLGMPHSGLCFVLHLSKFFRIEDIFLVVIRPVRFKFICAFMVLIFVLIFLFVSKIFFYWILCLLTF